MIKVTYHGSEKDIEKAAKILKKHRKFWARLQEPDARLEIQKLIDQHYLKVSILVNGNIVWSKNRILGNLKTIMKEGTLYNEDQKKPPILSHYFYQFLQACGSIAHVDIHGWVHKYPTIEHLKKFFKENEFGKPVIDWIPKQKTDARVIVEEIQKKLFPFENYMRTRNHQ